MTISEFKLLKPEYENINGDELWNAMEDYMLLHPELMEKLTLEKILEERPGFMSHSFEMIDLNRRK